MYTYNTRIWKSTNGCRTIYEKMDCTNNTSFIIICCQVGSIHETSETIGFAHLLEHILMTSDTNHMSCTQTFQQFDKMGIEFNAFTTKTKTVFTIKCLTEFLESIIDILGNVMFRSNILTRDALIEQNVIFHENREDEYDSNNKATEFFDKHVYKNTPYAKPIDKVFQGKKCSTKQLQQFYHTHYVPSNFILSIISDIPYKRIEKYVQKSLFVTLPNTHTQKRKKYVQKIHSGIHISKETTPTCTLIAGFCIPKPSFEEKCIFEFLQYHLNRMNGILFQHIRMQEGVAYRFYSEFEHYNDTGGYFSISIETSHLYIETLLTFVMDVFKNLTHVRIHEDTILQVKQYIKNHLQMNYNNFETIAEYNIQQIINHSLIPYNCLYNICYHPITALQIQNCANKYFTMPNVNISIVSNEHVDQSTIERICKTAL